jgi:hypothetical protein
LRVHADGRFIEKQNLGVVHEGAGDLEPSLHARGERPHHVPAPFRELDEVEHRLDPAAALRRRDAIDQPVEIEVLVQGQAIVEARLLEHDAEAAPGRQRILHHVDAVDAGAAAVGPQDGAEDMSQGGLAGAIGPEQREQFVAAHLEADVVQRQGPAEPLAHSLDRDRGLRHGRNAAASSQAQRSMRLRRDRESNVISRQSREICCRPGWTGWCRRG